MKEGWEYKTFKDQFSINMGKTPPRGDSSSWDKSKITTNKWVSIADISLNEGKIIFDTKEYISDKAAEKIKKVKAGSLLMSFKLTIGKMAFAGDDLFTNEAIIAIPQNEDYDLHFLYYYLLQYDWRTLTEGNEKVKGATLNKQSIGKIQLPIISMDEQRRIVSYLDSSFKLIDEIKNKALKSLTEAKALFQSALAEAMEPKEGTLMERIGDVFTTYAGGTPLKSQKDYYEGGEIPWLRSGEVCKKYISETELYITQKGMDNSSAKFYPENTVVVAMYGATAAQVGILKIKATSNQAVCGIIPHKDFIPEYVYYWFLFVQVDLASQAQGGAQPNISQIKIKNVLIPIIKKEEQKQIVSHLDKLSSKVQAIEEKYQKMVEECDALKQAMLRDVFE